MILNRRLKKFEKRENIVESVFKILWKWPDSRISFLRKKFHYWNFHFNSFLWHFITLSVPHLDDQCLRKHIFMVHGTHFHGRPTNLIRIDVTSPQSIILWTSYRNRFYCPGLSLERIFVSNIFQYLRRKRYFFLEYSLEIHYFSPHRPRLKHLWTIICDIHTYMSIFM